MEIFWTALHALLQKDYRLKGTTSIWMFPIYGMAVFLEPISRLLAAQPWFFRGLVYMMCIFLVEYASGWWIRETIDACPWDYSHARYHINGLVRLDYAPAWFAVGLIFERVSFFLAAAGI